MIGRAWDAACRTTRSTAAWIDFGVAVMVACLERLRAPMPQPAAEPGLVAQAITVRGGEAVVTAVHFPAPSPRRSIGPAATLAVAAAALAATVGARTVVLSGFGSGLAALASDSSLLSLRPSAPHSGGAHPVAATVIIEISPEAPSMPATTGRPMAGGILELDLVRMAEPEDPPASLAVVESEVAGAAAEPSVPVAAATPAATVEPVAPPPAPAIASSLPAFAGVVYTADQIRSLALQAGWPSEALDDLVEVARCESAFRPDVVGQRALGLMQMMPFWFPLAGLDPEMWSDPVVNLRAALFAYHADLDQGREPWAAWTCKPLSRQSP